MIVFLITLIRETKPLLTSQAHHGSSQNQIEPFKGLERYNRGILKKCDSYKDFQKNRDKILYEPAEFLLKSYIKTLGIETFERKGYPLKYTRNETEQLIERIYSRSPLKKGFEKFLKYNVARLRPKVFKDKKSNHKFKRMVVTEAAKILNMFRKKILRLKRWDVKGNGMIKGKTVKRVSKPLNGKTNLPCSSHQSTNNKPITRYPCCKNTSLYSSLDNTNFEYETDGIRLTDKCSDTNSNNTDNGRVKGCSIYQSESEEISNNSFEDIYKKFAYQNLPKRTSYINFPDPKHTVAYTLEVIGLICESLEKKYVSDLYSISERIRLLNELDINVMLLHDRYKQHPFEINISDFDAEVNELRVQIENERSGHKRSEITIIENRRYLPDFINLVGDIKNEDIDQSFLIFLKKKCSRYIEDFKYIYNGYIKFLEGKGFEVYDLFEYERNKRTEDLKEKFESLKNSLNETIKRGLP